jgi:hypothetical protein
MVESFFVQLMMPLLSMVWCGHWFGMVFHQDWRVWLIVWRSLAISSAICVKTHVRNVLLAGLHCLGQFLQNICWYKLNGAVGFVFGRVMGFGFISVMAVSPFW